MVAWLSTATCLLALSMGASATSYLSVCQQIAQNISSASAVYYPLSLNYTNDNSHWMSSSTQNSACTVEPGTAADVGKILQIVASTNTPFGVKGSGHASNQNFSSTTGVQIAMYRFSQVTYNQTAETATIGSGLVWDDVYEALEPYNVNIVGGRVSGVGVAGFVLGGGYSWKTSQHGLTIDNVEGFELVLPNGTATTATATVNPDLFFGLKGGFNNFGIVTNFIMTTYPQTEVWGGLIVYPTSSIPVVNAAIANFAANNTDPKASILPTYNYALGSTAITQLIFYDGPTPPNGLFDEFLNASSTLQSVSTRTFLSLVQAEPAEIFSGFRGAFHSAAFTSFPLDLLNSITNQTNYYGETLGLLESGLLISYDVEPFLPSLFSHNTTPTAYPPSRDVGFLPLNLYFAWTSPLVDTHFQNAMKESVALLKSEAIAAGQDVANAALYGNYVLADTPLEAIYGDNLPRLRAIKTAYDPNNVMGLAGGFKF